MKMSYVFLSENLPSIIIQLLFYFAQANSHCVKIKIPTFFFFDSGIHDIMLITKMNRRNSSVYISVSRFAIKICDKNIVKTYERVNRILMEYSRSRYGRVLKTNDFDEKGFRLYWICARVKGTSPSERSRIWI